MNLGDTFDGGEGQLFTTRGLANVLGVPECTINAALNAGRIKSDIVCWTGYFAIHAFWPASGARIREKLRLPFLEIQAVPPSQT